MRIGFLLVSLLLASAAGADDVKFKFKYVAEPGETSTKWRVEGDGELRLVYPLRAHQAFEFDCADSRLKVSSKGVVGLRHFKTGVPFGDGQDVPLPHDGVMLVLAVDALPQVPTAALATHNPAGGWDLVMEIARNDPAFAALPNAGLMSVIALAETTAVMLGEADRRVINAFVTRCRAM